MKLFEVLLERVNQAVVIDRDDLIFIQDALNKYPDHVYAGCFPKATKEAIKIMTGLDIDLSQLNYKAKQLARRRQGDPDKIHPKDIKTALKMKSGLRAWEGGDLPTRRHVTLDVKHDFVTSRDELKSWLRKGVPVIISMAWQDYFYWPYRYMRDGSDDALKDYKARGATPAMIKKVRQGIIPAPNEKLLAVSSRTQQTRHAIICVGYDPTQKVFICRDFLGRPEHVKFDGFVKLDEKMFFNPEFDSAGLPFVESGLAIEVKKVNDVPHDPIVV